jgi:flagellum-specific peptidoglycan hydrolase FlgJ
MPRTTRRLLAPLVVLSAAAATLLLEAGTADAAAVSATVKVAGSLRVRTGASTQTAAAGTLRNKAKVSIACQVSGQYQKGPVRATAQWDRLTNGRYISHAYVVTKTAIAPCPVTSPSPAPAPVADVTAGPVGSMTNAQFIAASVAPAQQGQREFRVPASVTIAQAILESGWGRSGLTVNDRNFFGIKCFNGEYGPIANGCHVYATYECLPVCAPTTAAFRTYASALDSFRDHGRFLTVNSRYRPAFSYTSDANQFLYQIWRAGYATSPTYVDNVSALMRQYNLYQYDLK